MTDPNFDAARSFVEEVPDGHIGGNAAKVLKAFVERIQNLEEEKANVTADIREAYAEAASSGFEKKLLRQAVRIASKDIEEQRQERARLDVYLNALGLL